MADLRVANALAFEGGPVGSRLSKPSAAIRRAKVVTACPLVAPTRGACRDPCPVCRRMLAPHVHRNGQRPRGPQTPFGGAWREL